MTTEQNQHLEVAELYSELAKQYAEVGKRYSKLAKRYSKLAKERLALADQGEVDACDPKYWTVNRSKGGTTVTTPFGVFNID
jgi:hypothetical protein